MEGTGIQPVMSMNPGYGYGDGLFGGNSAFAIFAILALMWGGGGFFGNRGYDSRCATVEDLNNSANFTRLESQVMNNGNRIEQKADYINNGICQLGYEIAQQFACTNANTTAQVQKVLDTLAQDKISSLQGRIQQLELERALCGVVRYPTSMTYAFNGNPFCGCGYQQCCGQI